jgi:hypothetical protein
LVESRLSIDSALRKLLDEHPSTRYVAPFAIFLLFLAIFPRLPIPPTWEAPLRVLLLAAVCIACWPPEISVWPKHWLASIGVGIAVFFLWIAPDVLIPGYRQHALFSNDVLGHLHSSIAPGELHNPWILGWRTARAALIVPVLEELFWRAWLMRWLINPKFQQVRLGAYTPFAFWVTAILFASEHGPYWDVGLITGVIYNLWMIRTRSVADCILMHATTNLVLSLYVIATAQWQYWQ